MVVDTSSRSGILRRPCPRCGQASLQRIPGQPSQRPPGGGPRRTPMRCNATGCGFEGPVARRARRRAPAAGPALLRPVLQGARRALPALGGLLLLGAVAGAGAAIGSAWERAHAPTAVAQRAALPAGEYHDGDPLPARHPLARLPTADAGALDLRGACVWGRPGRNPYRGTVAEALAAAHVPAEVRAALVALHAAHRRDGRLLIANDGIRDESGSRRFAAHGFAMTYGRTLCLETRVNFPAGHQEAADLYEATDAHGRRWSMMVPDVCGNVSLIAPAGSRLPPGLMTTDTDGPASAVPARPGDPQRVPEPGTLACLLAAALAWRLARRPPPPGGP